MALLRQEGKRHTAEQMIGMLRQAEVPPAQTRPVMQEERVRPTRRKPRTTPPDCAAAYLAVHLRAVARQRQSRGETIELMARLSRQGGVTLPEHCLAPELNTPPTFSLPEQLRLLDGTACRATADGWFAKLGDPLKAVRRRQAPPEPHSFVTDEYLKRVAGAPRLAALAGAR